MMKKFVVFGLVTALVILQMVASVPADPPWGTLIVTNQNERAPPSTYLLTGVPIEEVELSSLTEMGYAIVYWLNGDEVIESGVLTIRKVNIAKEKKYERARMGSLKYG